MGFIKERDTGETVVFRVRPGASGPVLPQGAPAPGKGARVRFRKTRSYDRKKDRLGWAAEGVEVAP